MFTRIAVAAFSVVVSVVVMAAGDDTSKDTSTPAASTPKVSVCRGLSEADCSANEECFWKAEKEKCKKKNQTTRRRRKAPLWRRTSRIPTAKRASGVGFGRRPICWVALRKYRGLSFPFRLPTDPFRSSAG